MSIKEETKGTFDELASSPNFNNRKFVFKMDVMLENVIKEDRIKENLEDNEKKLQLFVEKITTTKMIIFFIYFFSLIIATEISASFNANQLTNSELDQSFLNNIFSGQTAEIINNDYVAFSQLRDFNDIMKWLQENVIFTIYGGTLIFSDIDRDDPSPAVYTLITPIRLLQQRASLINGTYSSLFDLIWDIDGLYLNTTTYGSQYPQFVYNPSENGFNLTLPIMHMSKFETETFLGYAIENGFYDTQTSYLKIDFAIYSGLTQMITYYMTEFYFSPSGMINQQSAENTSFRIDLKQTPEGKVLIVVQIIFGVLSVYYFFQEFVKIYNQIRSAFFLRSNNKYKNLNAIERRAVEFRDRIKNILIGLFNHISDPWCLYDLISLSCSAYTIMIWIKFYVLDEPTRSLQSLDLKEGRIPDEELTPEKEIILYSLNQSVALLCEMIETNYIITAVNCFILVAKALKYASHFSERLRDLLSICARIVRRLIPFVILLIIILMAYCYVVYYYFGDNLVEFADLLSSLRYFVTNLHSSFSQVENMFKLDYNFTIIFHLVFIFSVNLILASQFIIIVTHEYMNYFKEKAKQIGSSRKIKERFDFSPHFIWTLKQFYEKRIKGFFKMILSRGKRQEARNYEFQETLEKNELVIYRDFNFDLSIEDDSKKSKLNAIFYSEKTLKKIRANEKIRSVKEIWRIVALWIVIAFCVMIVTEHHKVIEGRSISHSVEAYLNQRFIGNESLFPVKFGRFRELQDVQKWMMDLFSKFAARETIYDDEKGVNGFRGYFLRGLNLLITNKYRLSLRKCIVYPNNIEVYNTISSNLYSKQFPPDGSVSPEESIEPLTSLLGNIYNYTVSNGYANAGGYIFSVNVPEFEEAIKNLTENDFITYQFNSAVIDFPVLQFDTYTFLYVVIAFSMDDAGHTDGVITIDYANLLYYTTSYQKFVAAAECFMVIGLIIRAILLVRKIHRKINNYDNWYSINIFPFPTLMKDYRDKKRPEFFRKLSYVITFEEISDFLVVTIGAACAAFWIIYLTVVIPPIKNLTEQSLQTNTFMDHDVIVNKLLFAFKTLRVLRVMEPILIIILTTKIIYSYSYFKMFGFLTKTLKKTIKIISPMAILFFVILLGFSLFLHISKGSTSSDLSYIVNAMTLVLENFSKFKEKYKTLLTEKHAVAMTLIYYFPFVFFAYYSCSNIFLAMMKTEYKAAKREEQHFQQADDRLTIKQFFKITLSLFPNIRKKDVGVGEQNFSQQKVFKSSVKKVFEEFENSVEMAKKIQEHKVWASICAKNILDECEARRSLKRNVKNMVRIEMESIYNESGGKKKVDFEVKLSKHRARLGFWNYLRTGQEKILKFMKHFNAASDEIEKELEKHEKQTKDKNAEKIKKYILYLESTIEKNIVNVQKMKRKVDQYEGDKMAKYKNSL